MASLLTPTLSLILLALPFFTTTDAGGIIGVNYGRVADNLPTPDKVIALLKSQGITRVKLYDTNAAVLTSLSNTNISVVVALPNELLSSAANDQSFTDTWVQSNVFQYYPSTRIEAIAVGNEVFVDPKNTTPFLVPAMRNVYNSLVKFNLSNVKVSSPIALSCLNSSFPPSAGSFKTELVEPVLKPMLNFLTRTGSYLMVNAYPFFAYSGNSKEVSLSYTLFETNSRVVDSGNGLTYYSLLEAQLDAVISSMSRIGYNGVKLVVTETGWPSLGDESEIGAGQTNAATYNGNLVKRVLTGNGTPLRPQDPLNVYLFALFNEDLKPGPTSERNYGLFYANGEKVYNIPLTVTELVGGSHEGNSSTMVTVSKASLVGHTWCVANGNAGEDKLRAALDYVCGEGGADCRPIREGATCYNPNTIVAHASYAFNSYYQKNGRGAGTCHFGGLAHVVTQAPSYGSCKYPSGY